MTDEIQNSGATGYPHGTGEVEPVYLTNQCCEVTHEYLQDLLDERGISYGSWQGSFYPLTDEEAIFIGDDLLETADGYGALMGYSALYQNKKYLMPSIELCYGSGPDANETYSDVTEMDALDYGRALQEEWTPRLKAIGGHILFDENAMEDRHLLRVLIPIDYAMKNAPDFDTWRNHLENVLLKTDLVLEPSGPDLNP